MEDAKVRELANAMYYIFDYILRCESRERSELADIINKRIEQRVERLHELEQESLIRGTEHIIRALESNLDPAIVNKLSILESYRKEFPVAGVLADKFYRLEPKYSSSGKKVVTA